MDTGTVVTLVVGIAMFIVALLSLMVKLIELGRK